MSKNSNTDAQADRDKWEADQMNNSHGVMGNPPKK